MIQNKTKFEHAKQQFTSKVLNVQVEYFQFEYYFVFVNSINIKTISSTNEFLMHNQQYPL